MDRADLHLLPPARDPIDADLREVDAAIALVAGGVAVRVRLVGLASAPTIASIALAHAQAAGVDLRVERSGVETRLIFGTPRDP